MSARSEALLDLLRKQPLSGGRTRQVYLAADGFDAWYLTYSGELPKYRPFSRSDVDALAARGLIKRSYPNTDGCFELVPPPGGGGET